MQRMHQNTTAHKRMHQTGAMIMMLYRHWDMPGNRSTSYPGVTRTFSRRQTRPSDTGELYSFLSTDKPKHTIQVQFLSFVDCRQIFLMDKLQGEISEPETMGLVDVVSDYRSQDQQFPNNSYIHLNVSYKPLSSVQRRLVVPKALRLRGLPESL